MNKRRLYLAIAAALLQALLLPSAGGFASAATYGEATPVPKPKPLLAHVWPVTGGGPTRAGQSALLLPVTRTVAWSRTMIGEGIGGTTPAVDYYHRIYLCTNIHAGNKTYGQISCVSSSGAIVWQQSLAVSCSSQPVLLGDGTVLVYDGSRQLHVYTSGGVETGDHKFAGTHNLRSQPLPDPSGDFYILSDNFKLYRAQADGSLEWSQSLRFKAGPDLLIGGGTLFASGDDLALHCLSASSGQQTALLPLGTTRNYSVYSNAGWIYSLVSSQQGAYLQTIGLGDNRGVNFAISDTSPSSTIPPTLDTQGNVVFGVAGMNNWQPAYGEIIGLAGNGQFAWKLPLETAPAGTIVADAGGRLYFGSENLGDAGIYCAGPDHQLLWYLSENGVSGVFPVDNNLLGALVFSPGQSSCTLLAVGSVPQR